MNEHPHSHEPQNVEMPVDAGSQALGEALRASFAIVKFAMFLLIVVFLASGFFTVGPQERAIILRFGKPVGEGEKALLGPGLHWSLPYPIDDVQKIPVTEIQKVTSTVGWYSQTPEQILQNAEPMSQPSLNPATEGYVVTADGNIVHTRATLSYHISEPIHYVFDFTDAMGIVQNALDHALVSTAARFNVDDILRRNQAGFRDAVRSRASELLEAWHVGVVVENCEVDSRVPAYLRADFQAVTTADVNRTTALESARKEANETLAKAAGDAAARLGAAEAERSAQVTWTRAFADTFNELLPKYRNNRNLFIETIFYPRIGSALARVQEKLYLPSRADGKTRELRLLLNREPPKQNPAVP